MKKNNTRCSIETAICLLATTFILTACSNDSEGGRDTPSSSSEGDKYSYCVFIQSKICLDGLFDHCDEGGSLSNTCPFSSRNQISSSSVPDYSAQASSSSSNGAVSLLSSSSLVPSSSSNSVSIFGYCDYGPITEYGGGCFPMATTDDETNCAKWGNVVNSCDAPSSSSKPSSSSTQPSSSSSSVAPSSSSSAIAGSSSAERSSSSATPSSSSVVQFSSNSSSLCADFVNGTTREHYGKNKPQFCDPRDGKKYVYVQIGLQIWMAENLNYSTSGSRCYNNLNANCNTYGMIYDWTTAIALPSNCNFSTCASQISAKHRGICPEGWHIPNSAEIEELINIAGGSSTAGKHLKTASGWNQDNGKSGNGEDTYGFAALPGGVVPTNGVSSDAYNIGNYGSWIATDCGMNMQNYHNVVMMGAGESLRSVRCVQD